MKSKKYHSVGKDHTFNTKIVETEATCIVCKMPDYYSTLPYCLNTFDIFSNGNVPIPDDQTSIFFF